MLHEVVNLAAVTVLGLLEQGHISSKHSDAAMAFLRPTDPEKINFVRDLCFSQQWSAYFSLQVIYARRKYSVSPPSTVGPPEFERVFRAQANCSEYFPIFVIGLWVSGVFLSQAAASVFGVLYLYGRLMYFRGYSESALGRLAPLYFSARCLWMLIGLSAVGVLNTMCELYLGLNVLQQLSSFFLQS